MSVARSATDPQADLVGEALPPRAEPGSAPRLAPLTAFLRAGRVANTVPLAYRRSATRQEPEVREGSGSITL